MYEIIICELWMKQLTFMIPALLQATERKCFVPSRLPWVPEFFLAKVKHSGGAGNNCRGVKMSALVPKLRQLEERSMVAENCQSKNPHFEGIIFLIFDSFLFLSLIGFHFY